MKHQIKEEVILSLDDLTDRMDDHAFDNFLDFLSEGATGRIDMQEISYKVVGTTSTNGILVEVSGFIEEEE